MYFRVTVSARGDNLVRATSDVRERDKTDSRRSFASARAGLSRLASDAHSDGTIDRNGRRSRCTIRSAHYELSKATCHNRSTVSQPSARTSLRAHPQDFGPQQFRSSSCREIVLEGKPS